MSRIWDSSPSSGRELLVELALADFADDDGRCWPAVSTIAAKARCSEGTVHNTIRALVAAKRLDIKVGEGPYGTNVYVWLEAPKGGATIAPPPTTIAPPKQKRGAKVAPPGVQLAEQGGAISNVEIAPDPSLIRHSDPSYEPSAQQVARDVGMDQGLGDGEAIKAGLEARVTRGNYRAYIEPSAFQLDGSILRVIAPNEGAADWIRGRFGKVIQQAAGAGVDTIEVIAR